MVVSSDRRPATPVLVAFGAPAPQRRAVVAGRLFLAVPHIVVLALLAVGAVAVALVGWCGALVLGRLPRLAADYLSGYLRWQTRVTAYLLLLTDVYPPFSLSDSAYPVRLTTRPGPLQRWTVLVRPVLAVPALLVATTATFGVALVALVGAGWVVLVKGKLPTSLHQTFAAVVRYGARLDGYLLMVTSEYPWGILGDPEPVAAAPSGTSSWQPVPPSPVDDPYWQVVLTSRAKNVTVFALILGVASVAGVNIANTAARYQRIQTDVVASARVQSAYRTLSTVVIGYEDRTRSCQSTVPALPCLTDAAQSVARAFTVFVHRLSTTTMPGSATSALGVLVQDSAHAGRDFAQLSASTTAGHYELVIESSGLAQLLIRFDRDYVQLGTVLTQAG